MKILQTHNYYQQPGGEKAVFDAEKFLLESHGHEVIRYTLHNDAIKNMPIRQVVRKSFWNHHVYQQIRTIITAEKPDLLHSHNTWPLMSPALFYASQNMGVPVVQTLHNYRLFCPSSTHFYRDNVICELCLNSPLPRNGVRYACYRNSRSQTLNLTLSVSFHHWIKTWNQKVDVYIALTDFARRKYIEGGLSADKIMVKPNIVFPDLDLPAAQDKGNYVCHVGRMSADKGIFTMLKAWQHLPHIPLRIFGDGPLMAEMKKFVAAHQISSVDIAGRLPYAEIVPIIKGAQFLVFPSENYEGFPMTIAESFACGTPVVGSKLGAMAEIIADQHTGLHFTPGNPEDLAAKVDWAWQHPAEMAAMGKAARCEFETKYAADKNYQLLMTIYQRAISNHGNKK